MKITYTIKDLENKFNMNRMTIYRWINKYDIYYELTNTDRYVYTDRTIDEFNKIFLIKRGK